MTTFLEPVKEDILAHLGVEPYTINELAELINRPYTTVQQAHKILREEGKIIAFDRKARNARWVLGTGQINGPRDVVPKITFGKTQHKMTEFKGVTALPTAAADAMHTILKAWTIIATTADRVNGGIPEDVMLKRLNRQKVLLAEARTTFETMAFFATQIIENPKFWDVVALDQFPNDKDWEAFKPYLDAMYQHYFSTES